jgi:alpha-tubulin suppressor-like RCC1 family protein/Ca2+-binding EF-hand superfamily protein
MNRIVSMAVRVAKGITIGFVIAIAVALVPFLTFISEAELGNPKAELILGESYLYGWFVPKNDEAAFKWLALASNQGNRIAQAKLGVMYAEGRWVKKDIDAARNLWRDGAKAGFSESQYNLGVMYETGDGVRKSYVDAKTLYAKAAAQGNSYAIASLERLKRNDLVGQIVPQPAPTPIPAPTPATISSKPISVAPPNPDATERMLGWGDNNYGQLGSGYTSDDQITPIWSADAERILVPDFTLNHVSINNYTTCALRNDKSVWCWGDHQPVHRVEGLPPMESIEMGMGYLPCGKSEQGEFWCWERSYSQATRFSPEWISRTSVNFDFEKLAHSFTTLFTGINDSCAITSEGKVWCWGKSFANNGEPGTSMQTNNDIVPMEIKLPRKAMYVNAGFGQSCAILEDETAWCWPNKPEPLSVFGGSDKIKQIMPGWLEGGCALKSDGSVWCDFIPGRKNPKPVEISRSKPLRNVVKIDFRSTLPCALVKNGSVWCWGGRKEMSAAAGKEEGEAFQIKRPDGICNLGNVKDITVGDWSAIAVVNKSVDTGDTKDQAKHSQEFFDAVNTGDFDRARNLAKSDNNFCVPGRLGESALINAIKNNQPDLVKVMVDAGVDLELPDYGDGTALSVAANVTPQSNPAIIKDLIDHGADIYAAKLLGFRTEEGAEDKINPNSSTAFRDGSIIQYSDVAIMPTKPLAQLTNLAPSTASPVPKHSEQQLTPLTFNSSSDVYPTIEEIPLPFRAIRAEYPEDFVGQALQIIRRYARDKQSLYKEDIDAWAKKTSDAESRERVQKIIRFDRNLDGKVSRQEVVETLTNQFEGRHPELITRHIDDIMAADTNGDGVVTIAEMAAYDPHKNNSSTRLRASLNPESIFALDPNHDGKLTLNEMEKLAWKAFKTMDFDGDGILSSSELEAVSRINRDQLGRDNQHEMIIP